MGAEDNAKVNLVLLNVLVAKGKALVKITSFLWQLQCYKCGLVTLPQYGNMQQTYAARWCISNGKWSGNVGMDFFPVGNMECCLREQVSKERMKELREEGRMKWKHGNVVANSSSNALKL